MDMGWYNFNPKDTVRVYEDKNFVVDYNKDGKMYRVSVFEDDHFQDEFWFNEYKKDIGQIELEDDGKRELCKGCLSYDCLFCPKDDGYKCHGCPCDDCEEVDGKMSNWYDEYSIRFGY